ncbi:MAG: hypothetical protein ACE5Q6_14220, partial [Dehalococcoidia bacterium]
MRVVTVDEWIGRRGTHSVPAFPTRHDIESQAVFIPEAAIESAMSALDRNSRALLIGAEGRGKSTVAKIIAYRERVQKKRNVYVVVCSEEGNQSISNIGTAIENRNKRRAFWIVDDCQSDLESFEHLAEYINRAVDSRFLFIFRGVISQNGSSPSIGPLEDLVRSDSIVPIQPNLDYIVGVINNYISSRSEDDRFAQKIAVGRNEADWALNRSGSNLRTLTAYLDSWDPRKMQLQSLTPDIIWESILHDKLAPLTDEELQIYRIVATIYQFDVSAWVGDQALNATRSLVSKGLVSTSNNYAYSWLSHSSDGYHTIHAFSKRERKAASQITQEVILDYIQSQVPSGSLAQLMSSLAYVTEYQFSDDFIKQVGRSLISLGYPTPIYHYIRTLCNDLETIRWAVAEIGGPQRVADVARKLRGQQFRTFLNHIEELAPDLARRIEGCLSPVDRIRSYLQSNLRYIANSLVFYSSNSPRFAKELLKAVVDSDFDQRISRTMAGACGRFLQVAPRCDEDLSKQAAIVIAKNIDLGR